jgi:hypothetical protein
VYASASSRLHAVLTALMALDSSQALRRGWSEVLAIPEADVPFGPFGLPAVADLVSGTVEEAARAAESFGLPLRRNRVAEWSKPVYTPATSLDGPIHQQAVSPEALEYLDSVASVLARNENHPELPGGDELTDLLAQIDDLAASVEDAEGLPDDVRSALLRRIAHVRHAVTNVRVGGAEAVQEAVELLLGATIVRGAAIPKRTFGKVWAVVAAAFTLFTAGPAVQASLEAWPQVAETMHLSSGAAHHTEQAGQHEPPADHLQAKP